MINQKIEDTSTTASKILSEHSCEILNLRFKKSISLKGSYISDFRNHGSRYIILNENFENCLKVKGFLRMFEIAIYQCPVSLYSPTLLKHLFAKEIGDIEPYEVESISREASADDKEVITNLESVDKFVSTRLNILSNYNIKEATKNLSNISMFPAAVCVHEEDFPESVNALLEVEKIIGKQAVEIAQLGEEGTSFLPFSELDEFEEMIKIYSPLFEILRHFEGGHKIISAGLNF